MQSYTASQSEAASVNNSSVIGQKRRAGKEVEGRESTSAATEKDLMMNTSHCDVNNREVVECNQCYSKSNSSMKSNTNSSTRSNTNSNTRSNTGSNMARNSNRSSVSTEPRPGVQRDKSVTYKDSTRPVTVTYNDDNDEVVTTLSRETTCRHQSERRVSNTSTVMSTRQNGKVMFGKIARCFLTSFKFVPRCSCMYM